MKVLFMALLLSLSVMACGQTIQTGVKVNAPPVQKTLILDETWIVASGKSSFRIITSNDSVAHKFMAKFENSGMDRFTYVKKNDRKGDYWERSFYFKNECWNIVTLFINNKLK